MNREAVAWIRFLRGYGPVAQNDNMYDETIQRHARNSNVVPIRFRHPRLVDVQRAVLEKGVSVVLTGTAGDGKTHLCREMWQHLGGKAEDWAKDDPHLQASCMLSGKQTQLHVIRDLSAWVPQQGMDWAPEKARLLTTFCTSLFASHSDTVFLIAANDGQLIETLKRLCEVGGPEHAQVKKAFKTLEALLFEDMESARDARVRMFNLSRKGSRELFDLALKALLEHEGWQACYDADQSNPFFGDACPIRRNYELLRDPGIQKRLRQLLTLCFLNGFHVPIRQILLLLSNAILGHSAVPGPTHEGRERSRYPEKRHERQSQPVRKHLRAQPWGVATKHLLDFSLSGTLPNWKGNQ